MILSRGGVEIHSNKTQESNMFDQEIVASPVKADRFSLPVGGSPSLGEYSAGSRNSVPRSDQVVLHQFWSFLVENRLGQVVVDYLF
jgi:hypothetical protein